MDVTEPLTKLLTQPLLRAEFRADPRATACRLVREDTLRATLVGFCPDELDVQARLLIAKRWREVVAWRRAVVKAGSVSFRRMPGHSGQRGISDTTSMHLVSSRRSRRTGNACAMRSGSRWDGPGGRCDWVLSRRIVAGARDWPWRLAVRAGRSVSADGG